MSCGYHIKCALDGTEVMVVLGETITYIDLTDGTPWTGGDQSDLSWCGCASGQMTVTGVAGDTFPYDVLLPDGSTLTAGDPVPDGVVVIVEEEDGAVVGQTSFELGSPCCVQLTLCDPANGGAEVIALMVVDPTDGSLSAQAYYNDDGSPYAGDETQLIPCPPGADEVACIDLTKMAVDTGPYQPGQTVDYVFIVKNCGTSDLTGITVTDPLLVVLGGPIDLLPGETDATTFTGSYTVTQADVDAGHINNVATTTGTDEDGNPVSDTDDALVLTEECGTSVVCGYVGDKFDYRGLVSQSFDIGTGLYTFTFDNGTEIDVLIEDRDATHAANADQWAVNLVDAGGATDARVILVDQGTSEGWIATSTLRFAATDALACMAPAGMTRATVGDLDAEDNATALVDLTAGSAVTVVGGVGNHTTAVWQTTGIEATINTGAPSDQNVILISTEVDPVDGHTFQGQYTEVNPGTTEQMADWTSYEVWIRQAMPAEVTVDCTGTIIAAVDINGVDVVDLATVTVL